MDGVPNEAVKIIGLNAASFDAVKHLALPLVADAREPVEHRRASATGGLGTADSTRPRRDGPVPRVHRQDRQPHTPEQVTYAQVIGAIDRLGVPSDYA